MGLRELIMQFADERIQELISSRIGGSPDKEEGHMNIMEQVMEKIPPELQLEMELLISQLIDQRAEAERLLYISGLRDGVYIYRALLQ